MRYAVPCLALVALTGCLEGGAEPDGRPGDLAVPDGRLPDGPLPDGPLPDGPLPDGPLPDGPLPDGPPPAVAVNPLPERPPVQTCRLPEAPDIGDYDTEEAFPALRFQRPVWVGVAPGDAETMYVVEQGGTIYAFDRRREVVEAEVFLRVPEVTRDGNEEGLLGLAFHPDYAANGRLFVYNSVGRPDCPDDARRCSRISEFRRDPENPRRAQLGSQRVLLEVPQPSSNHNGGDLHFGPDGRLYASLGDGGGAGDRPNNAQNTNNLLGTILRIDVDEVPEGATYGIPPGNPFADGVGGRPEIWAWGLRNVWRMAFDPSTGLLWAGDVGQGAFEEIDVIVSGNYGWRGREGFVCFDDPLCDGDYIPPVHAYPRGEGTSVTGGLVYRGARLPALWGAYVFGDYGSGAVWALVEGRRSG